MSVDVQVRLLGPVEVSVGGVVRLVAGLRRRAVLAALALQPREVVSADELIDVVWDGTSPATAANSLQSHVSFLRRDLGLRDVIVGRAPGYVFDLGDGGTDVQVVEGLLRRAGGEADAGRRAGLLRSALGLWRGGALAGLQDLGWFGEQAVRLEGVRRGAAWSLTEARLALGEHGGLVSELEHLAERHQFDEELHRQLMLALYRCGRPCDALAVFGRLRRRLADELGVDPGPVLRGLEASILRHDEGLDLPVGGVVVPGVVRAVRGGDVLVERGAELVLVEEVLAGAGGRGSGSVVFFEGPAGIGKSSLLGHARVVAQGAGFVVAVGSGRDLERGHAWGCVRQLFDGVLSAAGGGLGSVGVVRELLAGVESGGGVDEVVVMRGLYRLVVELAERGPVLLVLDDLQWADLESVRFLAFVAARVERLPVVVLGALRPGVDEVDRVVAGFAQATRVLEPLSVAGGGRLLGGLVDGDGGLAGRCHEVTRGNPLLLGELCRHLVGAGSVEEGFERGVSGVRRLIQAQVRQLPVGAVGVAQALTVLGGSGSVEAVASTAGVGAVEALHQLAVLQGNRLVVEEGPGRFGFVHEVVVAAVYEGVRPGLRAQLHLRAAGAAMRTHDVVGAGSHLLRVPARWGDVDAVSVLGQAAEVCLARGAVDEAVVFLRRQLEEDLGAGRGRALTRLGMAEYLVDTGQAVQHLSAALSLETDVERRGQIALALALSLFFAGRPAAAHQVASDCLSETPDVTPSARHALEAVVVITAFPGAASTRPHLDSLDGAAVAPSPGGMMLEAALSWRDACRNDFAAAQPRALRAAGSAALHGQPLADGLLARAWHVLELCDSPAALPSIDAGLSRAERSGSPRAIALARCHRGTVLAAQGSLREAVTELALSWAETRHCVTELTRLHVGGNYIMALLQAGDVETADRVRDEMAAVVPQEIVSSVLGMSEILLLVAHGDVDRALEASTALRDECESRGITNPLFPDWRTPMISCLQRLGRFEQAREVAREFTALAAAWGTPRAVGRSLLAAAETNTGRQRIELLVAAKEQFEAIDMKSDLATALHRLGEALRRADEPDGARTHLHLAHELAVASGAETLAQDTAVSLRLLGVRPRTSRDGCPRRLTPSEARVVELAASGRSNREIAQELYIAVKTVEIHLTSSFRKLGISSRLDLRQATGQDEPDPAGRTTHARGKAEAP
ncbi:BTAD domain-containing putative transcriptional regulator [Catellatospora methionotrophica]|uniref:BTAD domain-containing putative transcriptional regulator n=1 Tax=Catellatospora methionotrophica TaxID=121620 RepID=UPI0033C39CC5